LFYRFGTGEEEHATHVFYCAKIHTKKGAEREREGESKSHGRATGRALFVYGGRRNPILWPINFVRYLINLLKREKTALPDEEEHIETRKYKLLARSFFSSPPLPPTHHDECVSASVCEPRR
jgi:hypothetical protein